MRTLRELLSRDRLADPDARREAECRSRRRAVAWTRAHPHLTTGQCADALHVSRWTLRCWETGWRRTGLFPEERGRPRDKATHQDVARMLGLLWVLGPTTGWESLRDYFPLVSRRELRRLLLRARRMWKRLSRRGCLALRWKRPATVWAIDFTEPPAAIEGHYARIFLVRDLASGVTLLALPCEDESEATAVAALRSLFLEHGAPLVLKQDNGAAFLADGFRDLLREFGVVPLYSPPRLPSYNGACEAGGGSLKTRAHHLAARAGRPGQWTLEDVEGARLLANETGRPHGASAPHPAERWAERTPIEQGERVAFAAAVESALVAERALRGPSEREPDAVELASLRRAAIARALVEQDLLEFRTRRVSPPISSFLGAIFS